MNEKILARKYFSARYLETVRILNFFRRLLIEAGSDFWRAMNFEIRRVRWIIKDWRRGLEV